MDSNTAVLGQDFKHFMNYSQRFPLPQEQVFINLLPSCHKLLPQ